MGLRFVLQLSNTVNPRITPKGLIYQQRYFGWGLINLEELWMTQNS